MATAVKMWIMAILQRSAAEPVDAEGAASRMMRGPGPTVGAAQHGRPRQASFSVLQSAGPHTSQVKATQTCHLPPPAEQEPALCSRVLCLGPHRLP